MTQEDADVRSRLEDDVEDDVEIEVEIDRPRELSLEVGLTFLLLTWLR